MISEQRLGENLEGDGGVSVVVFGPEQVANPGIFGGLDHGEFGRPGPPVQTFGKVALVHLLLLQPSLQLLGVLGTNFDQGRL